MAIEHGASAYTNWGCRCDVCTEANKAALRDDAERRKSRGEDSATQVWRKNHRPRIQALNRKQYGKRQAETLDRATRRGQEWTSAELELISRDDLSIREAALQLGRTYAAVQAQRKLLRERAEGKLRQRTASSSTVRTHGLSGYTRGCRCDICREAKRVSNLRSKEKQQRNTILSRPRGGYQWTGPELEIAARDDLTLAQIAKMLGRSYSAIVNIRHKLKHDPKTISVAGLAAAPARPDPEEQP